MMKVFVKDTELKRRIMSSGYSITSFAERLGVNRSFLSVVVNGRATLSPELAVKISNELEENFKVFFYVGTQEEYEELKEG